jgi:hypothetical protein
MKFSLLFLLDAASVKDPETAHKTLQSVDCILF